MMWFKACEGHASPGRFYLGQFFHLQGTRVAPKGDKKLQSQLFAYSLWNNWVQGAVTETTPTPTATQTHVPTSKPQRILVQNPVAWGKPPALSEAPSSAAWGVLAGDRKITLERQISSSTEQWILLREREADSQNEAKELVTRWQIHRKWLRLEHSKARTHKSQQAALTKLRIPGTAVGTARCHKPTGPSVLEHSQ